MNFKEQTHDHKTENRRTLKNAPPRRQAGVSMEELEDRRLMSTTVAPAGHSSRTTGSNTYDFNRPALHMLAMPAAVFGANVAAAFGKVERPANPLKQPAAQSPGDDPLFAPEREATTGEGDILTGAYAPRVKLWGRTRIGEGEDQSRVNPFAVVKTRTDRDFPPLKRFDAPPTARHHALVVEDDLPARTAIATLLQRRGWDVTAVGTLADGLRELHDAPEAVVLDLSLPDGDGETLLEEIRGQHLHTCVAVTTGFDDADRIQRLKQLEPDAILSKPVNVATLLHRLPHLPDTSGPALSAAA